MAEWVNEVFPKHRGWTQPNRSVGWNFCWRPWKRCKISMMKTLPHLASYFLMWGFRLHSDTPIRPGKIKWKNSKMEVDGRWCSFSKQVICSFNMSIFRGCIEVWCDNAVPSGTANGSRSAQWLDLEDHWEGWMDVTLTVAMFLKKRWWKMDQIMNIYCSSSRELVLWHSEFVLEYGLLIRGIFCDHRNEDAKRSVF